MRVSVVTLALALAGCQTDGGNPQVATMQHMPTNYRQIVAEQVKANFFDPYSIRDASISAPIASDGISSWPGRTHICVRANAKNRMGAYAGLKSTAFIVQQNGRIEMADYAHPEMVCHSAVYEPFPEIIETPRPTSGNRR